MEKNFQIPLWLRLFVLIAGGFLVTLGTQIGDSRLGPLISVSGFLLIIVVIAISESWKRAVAKRLNPLMTAVIGLVVIIGGLSVQYFNPPLGQQVKLIGLSVVIAAMIWLLLFIFRRRS